jgi:hypothetical protein
VFNFNLLTICFHKINPETCEDFMFIVFWHLRWNQGVKNPQTSRNIMIGQIPVTKFKQDIFFILNYKYRF